MARYLTKLLKPNHITGVASRKPTCFSATLFCTNATKSDDPHAPTFDAPNPFTKEKRKCILCQLNITPDYKNVKLLSQFQSPYTGRIYGRHITGLCEHKQTLVEKEIVKAQLAGFMASYLKEPCYLADPKLFDPEKPVRPHRF